MQELVNQVDCERLFAHIKRIEGIKHYNTNPKKLNETADYIKNEMESYGLQVSEQTFSFPELEFQFRNIEGLIGEGSKPELLITSHYDTVRNSPGANDNGSGVAAMLEAAKILSKQKFTDKNIRFVSFTLEEGNPVIINTWLQKGKELGLVDKNYQFKKYRTQKIIKEFNTLFYRSVYSKKSYSEASQFALTEMKDKLDEKEEAFIQILVDSFKDVTGTHDWIGKTALMGSAKWMEQALQDKKEILGVLNLETIGFSSLRKKSQKLPSPLFKLFPKYKTNMRKAIGNFIAITGDKNSRSLAKCFCKQCKNKGIELPYANITLPFSFKFMSDYTRDLLRSDPAPFLQHGIPALMITDTANFRYPYYHTEADTIDKLNFEFIKKVTQVTIATAISMLSNNS